MLSVPHNRLTLDEAECESVLQTVRSGHWAQGPRVRELETTLAHFAKVQHAVCVASGLAAIRLALRAFGLQSGESVLVPAYSCVALANTVLSWGARPVPVDIESANWNIDPERCLHMIAEVRPRAVIAVNTFGAPVELERIESAGIPVLEDCAHAFGLEVNAMAFGGRARAGTLSFYATKLIGAGEGGAVLTNSPEIAEVVRSERDYAEQPPDGHRLNDKMNDIEASLVLAQLQRLPAMISTREALARRYIQQLSSSPAANRVFRLPDANQKRVWYRFAIEMVHLTAATVVAALQRYGIGAALPVTDWRPPNGPSCPIADRAYRNTVSLPLYPTLTEEEQGSVVNAFLRVCEERASV